MTATVRRNTTTAIARQAQALGFDACAAAPVQKIEAMPRFRNWLQRGMHGSMHWLDRSADKRCDPDLVVPGARSVLVLRRHYFTGEHPSVPSTRASISCYAAGAEYHRVLGESVRLLYERILQMLPGARGRYYVDTGPVLEKAWAELAGIGWIGKHTNLISVGHGSWFFLAAILLDVELDYGHPATNHCGSCSACIDVCPTRAIVAPYVLDARRCISYLTIEHRGPIPRELRSAMGNHVFGCDDCQAVCPWNRFARVAANAQAFAARPENRSPALTELLRLDEKAFRRRFRDSPIRRAKRAGFVRNVAVALGNSGDSSAVPALAAALRDPEPLVRGHAAWALGRLGGSEATGHLRVALGTEHDTWVREEIRLALDERP